MPIRSPGALGTLHPSQHQCVDHATAAEFRRGLRVTGRCPERWMRTLPAGRPDIHVTMGEMLAFPAERPLMAGQSLHNKVDRFPETLDDANRIGVTRHHFAVAGLHET